jgi:hypothetical protein
MLHWKRTTIGGNEIRRDFTAFHGDEMVGRIWCIDGGPRDGMWGWTFLPVRPDGFRAKYDCHGTEATRQEAVDKVAELVRLWRSAIESQP